LFKIKNIKTNLVSNLFRQDKLKSHVNEIDGVIRITIDTAFQVGPVSVYLFKVNDSYVMYDAGLDNLSWKKLFFSELEKLNISLKDVDYCIISHEHLDHYGLMKKFKEVNPDMQIMMSNLTYIILKWETDPANLKEIEEVTRERGNLLIKYGMGEERVKKFIEWSTFWPKLRKHHVPDKLLEDGDEISFSTNKLKMIWTPGHSVGHLCMFNQKKRHLFSGDHILSRITPHIGSFTLPRQISEKYDFNDILKYYLQSLDRIEEMNPKIIFPGHQEVIHDPRDRINEIKRHHYNRLVEISKTIKNRPLTPFRISKLHFGRGLDELNTLLALSEVLAHLIYLENINKVKRIEKEGKILFES